MMFERTDSVPDLYIGLTDPQLKRWMSDLRSGRFLQTQGMLLKFKSLDIPEGYCCMGVLAVGALSLDKWFIANEGYLRRLPKPVEKKLAWLNDELKLTFPQIAAFIEGGGMDIEFV